MRLIKKILGQPLPKVLLSLTLLIFQSYDLIPTAGATEVTGEITSQNYFSWWDPLITASNQGHHVGGQSGSLIELAIVDDAAGAFVTVQIATVANAGPDLLCCITAEQGSKIVIKNVANGTGLPVTASTQRHLTVDVHSNAHKR